MYGYGLEYDKENTRVRVEYESTPIRHMAVQCPDCKNWFYSYDIVKSDCDYDYKIIGASCECPKCDHVFSIGNDSEIEEVGHSKIYDGCLTKQVTWVEGRY